MGCRLACETRYVARRCGCRMMHMPGKGLGSQRGVEWGGAQSLGDLPETVPPHTPGGAPVCSPQQYKDCANPALGKGQASPHTIPSLPASACYPHPAAGSPDPGNCGPQMPCCGRTSAPAPTHAPARATPRSSPWCGCRAALPPATWPGNTTAARPTSRELGRPGEGWTPLPWPCLPSHTWVGHQSARHHRALD